MRDRRPVTLLAMALLVPLLLSACGSDEPTPIPYAAQIRPARTAAALPTDTPEPTTEAEATVAARETAAAAPTADPDAEGVPAASVDTRLPEGDAVTVQLARIEPSPWEPEILAQMAPHFSLQADGYGVFRHVGGESDTGWYQTAITPSVTLDFLELLVDDIDVLGIAERRGEPEIRFETGPDGEPAGTDVLGVIYVKTADREGRLVIPEQEMENPDPDDPDAERLMQLHALVKAIELWKGGVAREFTPGDKQLILDQMGFWSDIRRPYTPTSAVAYGTAGRTRVPSDAPVAEWPLRTETGNVRPIDEVFPAEYGATPEEVRLEGDDLTRMLRAARDRDARTVAEGLTEFWGPLWAVPGETGLYLIGLRAAVPGSNHAVVDYEYVLPKRGIGLSAE